MFFYDLVGKPSTTWSETYGKVRIIFADRLVSVKPPKDGTSTGNFSIGTKKNWLYSVSLHPDPDLFEQELLDMLSFALTGKLVAA